jgi:purine nucleosidase
MDQHRTLGSARAPLYLDCDTGIDDALALAYLLASPEIELVGIGTVSGNVSSIQAARNTLDLLAFADANGVPVAIGAIDPLAGTFDGGAPHVHGDNGIGGLELPLSPQLPVAESAAELLIALATAHPGELRILAIGPLTNLAEALTLLPELPNLVHSVTIMGGAALVPGNISVVAEANIGNDPEAAAAVFAAAWPITLVPLDVTLDNSLEETHRQQLLASERPVANLLGRMLEHYFDFNATFYGRQASALHDPLAAAIAVGVLTPGLAPIVHVTVDATRGPGRGQTLCDLRGRFLGYPEQEGARCSVVLSMTEDFAPRLMERLLSV